MDVVKSLPKHHPHSMSNHSIEVITSGCLSPAVMQTPSCLGAGDVLLHPTDGALQGAPGRGVWGPFRPGLRPGTY